MLKEKPGLREFILKEQLKAIDFDEDSFCKDFVKIIETNLTWDKDHVRKIREIVEKKPTVKKIEEKPKKTVDKQINKTEKTTYEGKSVNDILDMF